MGEFTQEELQAWREAFSDYARHWGWYTTTIARLTEEWKKILGV